MVSSALHSGVVSMATEPGRARRTSGLCGMNRCGGNAMWPARCNASINPRHTMSRGVPLGWTQFHASHSFFDNARRLAVGCAAIRSRMKTTSVSVIARPRYANRTSMTRTVTPTSLERKSAAHVFPQASARTDRHAGAACVRSGLPAERSTCSSCASNVLLAPVRRAGHQRNRPLESLL